MFMTKALALASIAFISTTATALSQGGSGSSGKPQIESIGNGCYNVSFTSYHHAGAAFSSHMCGQGEPQVTDYGNGCYVVTLGKFRGSSCGFGASFSTGPDSPKGQDGSNGQPDQGGGQPLSDGGQNGSNGQPAQGGGQPGSDGGQNGSNGQPTQGGGQPGSDGGKNRSASHALVSVPDLYLVTLTSFLVVFNLFV